MFFLQPGGIGPNPQPSVSAVQGRPLFLAPVTQRALGVEASLEQAPVAAVNELDLPAADPLVQVGRDVAQGAASLVRAQRIGADPQANSLSANPCRK